MFDPRRIHTTVWDVIQGRHQDGRPLDLHTRLVSDITIGIPFFIPNKVLPHGKLGWKVDKEFVDRYLLTEPIFIDFDEEGVLCIRNMGGASNAISTYPNIESMNLEPNMLNPDDLYGAALHWVKFDAVDVQVEVETRRIAEKAKRVAVDVIASTERPTSKSPLLTVPYGKPNHYPFKF